MYEMIMGFVFIFQDLDKTLPILTPDFREFETSPSSGVRVCWLGHASVLVQFDNITVLTDPIFSHYCSPVKFTGPKRYRDAPCTVEDLPRIDAVVISHNHYDHLDVNSVQDLNKKYGEDLHWVVPMGLASWMRDCGCKNVVELEWWDKWSFPGREVTFVCTPSKHWCNRGIFDRNKVLGGKTNPQTFDYNRSDSLHSESRRLGFDVIVKSNYLFSYNHFASLNYQNTLRIGSLRRILLNFTYSSEKIINYYHIQILLSGIVKKQRKELNIM